MKSLRIILVGIFIMSSVIPSQSQARPMTMLSYQELLDKSNLVVVAVPTTKTVDTKEVSFLPDIGRQDKNGKQSNITSIGVETVFEVSAVLKGDKTRKTLTLHHYREAQPLAIELNGPLLVSFDPEDPSKRGSYLLFLVHEPDGRFAPTGGQTDPGLESSIRLSPPMK
jgi:hypothetical protein